MNRLIISVFALSFCLVSCQQNNNGKIIELLEDELNSPQYKLEYENIGAHGGYGILKKKEVVEVLQEQMQTEMNAEKKRQLDALVFNELVNVEILNKKSFINTFGQNVTTKDVIVNPTEKGRKLIVGETTDKYIFNIFKLENIKLIGDKIEKEDSIFTKYTIGKATKTDAYDCLENILQNSYPRDYLNDTLDCILLRKNGDLELIKY